MSLVPRPRARRATARLLLAGLVATGLPLASGVTAPALAAGTVRAEDPAPSPSGGVTVLYSTVTSPGDGYLSLVGEVRNDWDKVVAFSQVHVDLLGADGAVLDRHDVYTHLDRLAPGERSSFQSSFTKPAGYASYRVTGASRKQSSGYPDHRFTVALAAGTADSSSRTISGTVRNDNTAPVNLPAVVLALRDANGQVYDVETAYPTASDGGRTLVSGATAAFSVTRPTSDPYDAAGSVTATAESSSPTSPYPTQLGLSVPKKVSAGEAGRVTITALGKGTTGAVPAGVKVQLFGRETGQRAFRLLRTVTTTGGETLSFQLKPQRDIRWQARVPQATNAEPATSGYTLTQVAFGVSTTGTTQSDHGTLTGGVRPASKGAPVYLQQQVGGVFRNVASTRLSSSSTYGFTLRKPAGRYYYRVYKPAVPGNQAGYGPVMAYTVF